MLLRSSQVRTGHLQPVEPEFEPEHNCEHEHEHHHMSPRPPRSRRRRAMHTTRRGSQSLSTPLLIISVFVLLSSHCFQQPVFAVCARRLQQQIYDQLQQEHHQSPPPSSHFASSSSSSSSSFSLLHSSLRPLFPLSSSTSSSSKNATLSFQCPSILPHDFPSFSSSSSDPLSDSALLSLSRNVSTLFALLLLPAGTCTATRVGHRYLLTAAQCLRDFNASGTSADYRVLFANVSSEKVVYSVDGGRVKAFRRHPKFRDPLRFARQGYSVHDRYKKYDVAWLRLARVKKKNGNRNNNKPRQPSNRRPFHDPPQGDPNNNSSSSTSPSFFTTLNRHPDLPSPGSTVRIAGFGRYSGFIEGEYSYYSDDVEDGVDWKDPRFYEARQVDMKVLGNRFKQCRYPPGYNESSQICVGYGDENEKYYPADFDLKCNPW